ncbi:MAG TPA: hypothetical protein VN957_21545 [Chthoniobacterales bacterium]|nr:hypothetical protein [Chthoniobacterales bacterium]
MKRSFPKIIEPMMASVIKDPFDSPDWIFETKMDGYRAIAVIDSAGKARLWSRNRLPLEPNFDGLDAIDQLNPRSTILDGEIVALDADGIPWFQLLQQWQKRPTARRFDVTAQVFRHQTAVRAFVVLRPQDP